jgi:hypothetical protein
MAGAVASMFFNISTIIPLKDAQSGLRFSPRGLAPFFAEVPGDRLDYEFASLIERLSVYPDRPRQAPVETVRLEGDAASPGRSPRTPLAIWAVLVKLFWPPISVTVSDFLILIVVLLLRGEPLVSFVVATTASTIRHLAAIKALAGQAGAPFAAWPELLKELARRPS